MTVWEPHIKRKLLSTMLSHGILNCGVRGSFLYRQVCLDLYIGHMVLRLPILVLFTFFMARTNCAMNPCICFIFSSNYRIGLKNLFLDKSYFLKQRSNWWYFLAESRGSVNLKLAKKFNLKLLWLVFNIHYSLKKLCRTELSLSLNTEFTIILYSQWNLHL